jgi:uncharacterized membrane protein (UPF0127 family)
MSGLLRSPETPHQLVNRRNGAVLANPVVTAVDSASRRRGLLGLAAMPTGQALIIAPSNAIHTWFMRFPIDIAFVAKNGEVVKRCDAVRPWRMTMAWRGYAAIEFAAGVLAASDTLKGDVVETIPAN